MSFQAESDVWRADPNVLPSFKVKDFELETIKKPQSFRNCVKFVWQFLMDLLRNWLEVSE